MLLSFWTRVIIAVRSKYSSFQLPLTLQSSSSDIDQDVYVVGSYIFPESSVQVYNIHFNNCNTHLDNINSKLHFSYAGDFNIGSIDCNCSAIITDVNLNVNITVPIYPIFIKSLHHHQL